MFLTGFWVRYASHNIKARLLSENFSRQSQLIWFLTLCRTCFHQPFEILPCPPSMAQGPTLHDPGLERDYRQDEFSARYPSGLIPNNNIGNSLHHVAQPLISETDLNLPLRKSATENPRQICGLRVSTFWRVVTVIVLLILSGVGAAVLGSRSTGRGNNSPERKRYVRCTGIKKQGSYVYYSTQH